MGDIFRFRSEVSLAAISHWLTLTCVGVCLISNCTYFDGPVPKLWEEKYHLIYLTTDQPFSHIHSS